MRSAQSRWHHNKAVVMAPAEGPLGVKPVEKGDLGTETEAERHLKRMLDKQLDTKLTLKAHFDKHRQFMTSSTYTPLAELISGTHTLEEFSKTEQAEEMYKELQRSELTEEEITLYVAHISGKEHRKKKIIEPGILNEKIRLIESKLKNRQEDLCKPQVFSGVKTLSRHEMDIEKSLYAGCDSRNEFPSVLINPLTSPDKSNCNDPFTYIKTLSEKFKTKRQKRKSKSHDETDDVRTKVERTDDTVQNCAQNKNASEFEFDPYIHHVVVPLNTKDIEEQRLTVSEIKELPKFSNYNPGEPNKVLYLKNLPPKVTVQELIALFGSFDSETSKSINYRLLTGRMKGQAFVSFKDLEVAKKALNLVNGYLLRGRPVIIEYGKNEKMK